MAIAVMAKMGDKHSMAPKDAAISKARFQRGRWKEYNLSTSLSFLSQIAFLLKKSSAIASKRSNSSFVMLSVMTQLTPTFIYAIFSSLSREFANKIM